MGKSHGKHHCTNEEELKAWDKKKTVIGIDEAGRGCIAGPLVVAGVCFPVGYTNPEIYDSKALSEKKREQLFELIVQEALEIKVEIVAPKVIDELNIYRATQQAMEKIALDSKAEIVLSDAMPLPNVERQKEVVSLIKGDQKSISIAAGSIIAKVTRDRIMKELDLQYPQYHFAQHKGYPTKAHLEALEKYGVQDFYRFSYAPVQKCHQLKLEL